MLTPCRVGSALAELDRRLARQAARPPEIVQGHSGRRRERVVGVPSRLVCACAAPKTAYWKLSAALEAASKAAVEALAKLDFFLTPVGLLTRPEVCSGTADPSTSPSRRGSARNASSDRVPRDGCGSRACCKCATCLGSAARSRR